MYYLSKSTKDGDCEFNVFVEGIAPSIVKCKTLEDALSMISFLNGNQSINLKELNYSYED